MKYAREYVYPDCIRFYVKGDLVATASTRWMSDLITEALDSLEEEE